MGGRGPPNLDNGGMCPMTDIDVAWADNTHGGAGGMCEYERTSSAT